MNAEQVPSEPVVLTDDVQRGNFFLIHCPCPVRIYQFSVRIHPFPVRKYSRLPGQNPSFGQEIAIARSGNIRHFQIFMSMLGNMHLAPLKIIPQ